MVYPNATRFSSAKTQSRVMVTCSMVYFPSGEGIAVGVGKVMHAHRAQGFERCSVDFESFNPGAACFWMKYIDPVVYSFMRHPEAL
jgi:hypothetical protein